MNAKHITDRRQLLEDLYFCYNRREYIDPDPLVFVNCYKDPLDQEVVGLVASSLAYGGVAQIMRSVGCVLRRMGSSPHQFLVSGTRTGFHGIFKDFRHRFTSGAELAEMLFKLCTLKFSNSKSIRFFSWIFRGKMDKYTSENEIFVSS